MDGDVVVQQRARRRLKHRSGADRSSQRPLGLIAAVMPPIVATLPTADGLDDMADAATEQNDDELAVRPSVPKRKKTFGLTVGLHNLHCHRDQGDDATSMDFAIGDAIPCAQPATQSISLFASLKPGRPRDHKSSSERTAHPRARALP